MNVRVPFGVLSMLLFCGCASIVSKSSYNVSVISNPSGANVTIKNRNGKPAYQVTTPTVINLAADAGYFKSAQYDFEFRKPGYDPASKTLAAGIDGWYFANIVFGGLIGLVIVDPLTGAMWRLDDNVSADLSLATGSHLQTEQPATGQPTATGGPVLAEVALPVSSNAPVNVAVSDLTSSSIAAHESLTLSENLRNVLFETGYFTVISRGDMDSVLKEQNFQRSSACDDTGCLVEMGKLLAAQKMVGGMIGKVGETYSVTLRLVDVQTGRIEAVSTINLKSSPDELLDIIRNAGRALALKYHQTNVVPAK